MKTLFLMLALVLALASCSKDKTMAHLQSTVFMQSCEITYYAGGYLANQRNSHGYENYTFEVSSGDVVYVRCDTNRTGKEIFLSVSIYLDYDGTVLAEQDLIILPGQAGCAQVMCP